MKVVHVLIKIVLFDNRDKNEILLFVQNLKIMLDASGIISSNAKLYYLRTIISG